MSGVAHQHLTAAAAAAGGANAVTHPPSMPRPPSPFGNDDFSSSHSSHSKDDDSEKDADGEEEDRHAAGSSSTTPRRSGRGQAAGTKRSHSNMDNDEIVVKNAKPNTRRKANSKQRQPPPAQQSVFTSGKAALVTEQIEASNKKDKKEQGHTGWALFGVIKERAIEKVKVDGEEVDTEYQVVWCGTDKDTGKPWGPGKVFGPTNLGKYHLSRWEEFKRRTGRTQRTFQELLAEYP